MRTAFLDQTSYFEACRCFSSHTLGHMSVGGPTVALKVREATPNEHGLKAASPCDNGHNLINAGAHIQSARSGSPNLETIKRPPVR